MLIEFQQINQAICFILILLLKNVKIIFVVFEIRVPKNYEAFLIDGHLVVLRIEKHPEDVHSVFLTIN